MTRPCSPNEGEALTYESTELCTKVLLRTVYDEERDQVPRSHSLMMVRVPYSWDSLVVRSSRQSQLDSRWGLTLGI